MHLVLLRIVRRAPSRIYSPSHLPKHFFSTYILLLYLLVPQSRLELRPTSGFVTRDHGTAISLLAPQNLAQKPDYMRVISQFRGAAEPRLFPCQFSADCRLQATRPRPVSSKNVT